ncbi:hypothetical protein [Micromonospora robiginosa]|uniref:NADH:flavin oxidoreductase/NADH oxidase family protein n=1 Tax=Micromonospora robiginosa TaxID=2749844 RepID=A0A7L6AYV2_9ACTN|nr:hypothetical protein [Micromonospora ferruginea]QLQ34907.1 hypothetical protein H1D33_26225 [Micromonospora ferruginea]
MEAVAATIGAHRIGLRLSPGAGIADAIDTDTDTDEVYAALLAELVPLGPAYVHLAGTDEPTATSPIRRTPTHA